MNLFSNRIRDLLLLSCLNGTLMMTTIARADISPEIPKGQKVIQSCARLDMSSMPDYIALVTQGTGEGWVIPGGRGTSYKQWILKPADTSVCLSSILVMSKENWLAYDKLSAEAKVLNEFPTTTGINRIETYVPVATKANRRTVTYKADKVDGGNLILKKVSTVDE